jgi:hypothetical protein
MPQCEKCWKELGFNEENKVWNIQLKEGYINKPEFEDGFTLFTGTPIAFPAYKGKKLCKDCAMKLINSNTVQKTTNILAPLLQCGNACLTNKEFSYRSGGKKAVPCKWLISDMTMAIVQDNGSLGIIFNDGTKEEFKLSIDNQTILSAAGIALFGGVGTMIAGNMALKNQIKTTSQQWASAINMLISKGKLPEMIYCKYCGTKNKSTDAKCLHCGAMLE